MEEYILHNFGEKDHQLLKNFYTRFLDTDPIWHFFYEGSYSLLRVEKPLSEKAEKFLKGAGVSYEHLGEWKEPWEITKKYKKMFQLMFHSFSVLCMKMTEEEFPEILDRVTHCFLNNARTPERVGDRLLWEPMCLHETASKRTFFIGQIIKQHTSSK